eukprot:scaffold680902_cov50-Prasinocladus_malaysianus.AAC.1
MREVDGTADSEWYEELMPVTFTLQQLDSAGRIVPVDIAPGKTMTVSAIVKFDNRRKHNSHEWSVASCSSVVKETFLFIRGIPR